MTYNNHTVFCAQGPKSLNPTHEGRLSGLRFVFKDLFDVEGYITGAGNPMWLKTHTKAQETSPIISTLLSEGAQCVGRVQTDELAYSLNGQNIHYGTPINPKAPNCIPGGSSSGSAVAVAYGDADFAIGTDTGGSVRVPASYCGIFGLRPTLRKLSLQSAFELSKSFDTAGLFTRKLSVLKDVYQSLTGLSCDAKAYQVACIKNLTDEPYYTRFEKFSRVAHESGVECVGIDDNGLLSDLALLSEIFRTVQGYEIIQQHGKWLEEYLDAIDPAIAQRVIWARSITQQDYYRGVTKQNDFLEQFMALLEKHGGIIALPTTPSGPPKLTMADSELAEYRSELMGLTAIAGLLGCPQLHIPILDMDNGPCGISLLGVPDSESVLINTAISLAGDREGL